MKTDLLIFWLIELIFPICQILCLVKAISLFLNKSSNPYGREAFHVFFLQVETVTEIYGNPLFFWKEDFIPASRKQFSVN